LDIRRTEIPDFICFADCGFTLPVRAMTGHAFCLVKGLPAGLRLRGHTQKSDSRQDHSGCDAGDALPSCLHVFLLIRNLRGLNKISVMPFFPGPP
jgi:hypothetical protein